VRAYGFGDSRIAVWCSEYEGGPTTAPNHYDTVVTVDAIVHVHFGVCGAIIVGG
jgi:hypothetical protein